jgi:hypothetical protein
MKTYIQIGAGGTGTHLIGSVLAYLNSYHQNRDEQWQYVIIDGDNFDSGNAARQLFEPGMVSMNKAESMARMHNAYPIHAVPRFIGAEDLSNMVNEGDTVLICADNHSIRALVQDRALQLDNVVVINAGNELHDGNIQLWVREDGKNKTPKLTYLHPEIVFESADDRAAMSCQQAAALPGGGQLILANQQAASWMLAALWRYHEGAWKTGWTELQFDLLAGTVHHIDMRERRGWAR